MLREAKASQNPLTIHAKSRVRTIMPEWTKSKPKGSQKCFQIQVFDVKKRKKGAAKNPSVHWESISWPKVDQKWEPQKMMNFWREAVGILTPPDPQLTIVKIDNKQKNNKKKQTN